MNAKPPACPPDDGIRHALNRLVCAYVDLKLPVPDDLAFMLPDDDGGSARRTATGSSTPATHRFAIPTCFSPLYSADTPTASMRKLGPVAWQAVAQGWADVEVPDSIDPDKLRRLHAPAYVNAFLAGRQPLASSQGWPWTPQIRDGVLAINAGQLLGAELAMEQGIAANIAQGAHHAGYSRGGGYCTFNFLALTAKENPGLRVFVLDCDEHSGNGTAEFTERLPNLWNFTIFGSDFGDPPSRRNFRRHIKGPVTKDFGPYRRALEDAFEAAAKIEPDLVLFQAAADCHANDPLGSVGLTDEQMFLRDKTVFQHFKSAGVPVLANLAGGYQRMGKLVELHVGTFRAASEAFS